MSILVFGATLMVGGHFSIPPTMNVTPKHEKLIFGLLSTSDDRLSHLSNESCQKCNKMIWQPLFSHFWQLLQLRLLSRSSEVKHNPKMGILFFGVMFMVGHHLSIPPTMNVTPKHEMLISGLLSTFGDQPSHLSNESCQKCNKMIWQPLFSHFWQLL